jgi:nitroreductase/NAD-dependent dihydropyrimidine dehydrogenase PreA subunit
MENVWIDPDRCTLCGTCIPVCSKRIIAEDNGTVIITAPAQCTLCGHCKAVCPADAPQLPSMAPEEFTPVPNRDEIPLSHALLHFLRSRRSIRIFQDRSVAREELERVVEAGRFAPTGGNRQSLRYAVVHSPAILRQVRKMTVEVLFQLAESIERERRRPLDMGLSTPTLQESLQGYIPLWEEMPTLLDKGVDRLFYHAPSLFVIHVSPSESAFPEVDATLAAMHMVLMAQSLGLGTCFSGLLVLALRGSPALRALLQIPSEHRVPVAFVVGHPGVTFLRLVARKPAMALWL